MHKVWMLCKIPNQFVANLLKVKTPNGSSK